MSQKKIGIIQSRGLGDIIIALPIARAYTQQGYEVYWPVCEPFYHQMMRAAPWVRWLSVPVDQQGQFFYENPHKQLAAMGVTEELWLYQYLSSHPEKTNKSWFAQFKFDQYKYAAAGVPFGLKWQLAESITRDPAAEDQLFAQEVGDAERWMVYQGVASDLNYDVDLDMVEPEVKRIELRELEGYSIFDWLKIIEGAEAAVLIDSVFANLIDQLNLTDSIDCYYLRKWNRRVDGNPVFMGDWTYLDVEDPPGVQVRSLTDTGELDRDRATQQGQQQLQQQQRNQQRQGSPTAPGGETYTPYGKTGNTHDLVGSLQQNLSSMLKR